MVRRGRHTWAALLVASLCLSSTVLANPLEDPMRPPGFASIGSGRTTTAVRRYTLSSTFITRNRRSAIVNGRRVEIGSMLGDTRVVEILPTEVRLRHRNGRITTLELLPITVKTPVRTE